VQERGALPPLSGGDDSVAGTTDGGSTRLRILSTFLAAAIVVAADQVTKTLALDHLHQPTHLIGPLGLSLTFNTGAAFSLFTGATGVVVAIALILVALLGVLAARTRSYGLSIALGLILGGAVSNLADRLFRGRHGAVEDFITLTHWPTFNIADASITVGAILVVVFALFGRGRLFSR
jgi:signal peptidase II